MFACCFVYAAAGSVPLSRRVTTSASRSYYQSVSSLVRVLHRYEQGK